MLINGIDVPKNIQMRIEDARTKFQTIDGELIVNPGLRYRIHNVTPLKQNGPQCGLIATQMSAELCGLEPKTIEEIYMKAKENGYTKQGEMFSAMSLAFLVTELWGSDVATESCAFPMPSDIIRLVHSQSAILLPYDCDKNHEPVNRNGHAAHWCLVVGYVYVDGSLGHDQDQIQKDFFSGVHPARLFLLTRHGKSQHMGVWSYEALKESNGQLNDVVGSKSSEEFVFPSTCEGTSELKGRAVVIKKDIETD